MTNLIERIESAKGSSRELDWAIAESLGWTRRQVGQVTAYYAPGNPNMKAAPPEWTASIDAALTLVPEGWCVWQMGEVPDNGPLNWHATLWQEDAENPAPCCYTPTLALALCVAALRARGEQP